MVAERGGKGLYAVAPQMMTTELVGQFGPDIISPPTAPIVLIPPDQASAELLPRGIKSADELEQAVSSVQ
jgi:hypothetical protein